MLLFGVGLYVAASIVCALAPSIEMLIVARFCRPSAPAPGRWCAARSCATCTAGEGAARILAYMSMAMALAPALGPILGGFLEVWFGWRSNFSCC